MSFRVINQNNSGLTKDIIGRELELIRNIRANLELNEVDGENEIISENSDDEDELQSLAKVITHTIQTPRYSTRDLREQFVGQSPTHWRSLCDRKARLASDLPERARLARDDTPRPLNSIKSQKINKIKKNLKYSVDDKNYNHPQHHNNIKASPESISLFETPRTNTKTNKGVPIRPKKFIKLTYNNPKYILKKDELYDIFSGETHNKILDYTGEDVKGKIILPYEDSPKCAREIISLFGLDTNIQTTEIEESQSIYFSINRQVSGSCGELDIELLGNENGKFISLYKNFSNIDGEKSNKVTLWDEKTDYIDYSNSSSTDFDNFNNSSSSNINAQKFYIIIKCIDLTKNKEKVEILFRQGSPIQYPLTSCFYTDHKIFNYKDFAKTLHPDYNSTSWFYSGFLHGKKSTYSLSALIQKSPKSLLPIHRSDKNDMEVYLTTLPEKSSNSSQISLECDKILGPNISAKKIKNKSWWGLSANCDTFQDGVYFNIEFMGNSNDFISPDFFIKPKLDTLGASSACGDNVAQEYVWGNRNMMYKMKISGLGEFRNQILEILMEDKLGIVQSGFGESSFLPLYLTNSQSDVCKNLYSSSLSKFLEKDSFNFKDYGLYLLSNPLIEVLEFILYDDTGKQIDIVDKNKQSSIFVDNINQTIFDYSQLNLMENIKYKYFVIPIMYYKTTLVILETEAPASYSIKYARLYQDEGEFNFCSFDDSSNSEDFDDTESIATSIDSSLFNESDINTIDWNMNDICIESKSDKVFIKLRNPDCEFVLSNKVSTVPHKEYVYDLDKAIILDKKLKYLKNNSQKVWLKIKNK